MKENVEPAGYKELHLSLLAGLLSHMGFKQENKEFLGARNRKFHIFPSSALFKKPPKWIIAAELVETTKLYARMIAKVEPEWAESLASHLVKRTHLEPTWHKKRGQVVAIEQVTLFGLLIVPKRLVNYGALDKEVSHEIFIRSALVEGDFDTKGAFFRHNQQLLDHVEGLEAKARRKDLLVDEETLYDFYYQKLSALGGGDIVNAAGFEQWRKQVEAQDEKALFLTKEDILQRSAAHVSKQSYPDELIFKGMKLKLSYHFEPGAVDDGVSVTVPLALLKQLPVQRLEWLVPGMLQEKCVALLRALPKNRRKHFVPVPDYSAALVNALEFGEGDLLAAISHQLLRMTGIKVATEEFQLSALDDHHRINIKLQDGNGKIIAQGRDWENLSERYGAQADQAIAAAPDEQWGRKGIESWDFGELAEKVKIKQAGGLRIDAWPSLIDHNTTVELAVSLSESEAYEQSIKGVTRLAMLTLGGFLRPIRDKIPKMNEGVLLSGKIFTPKSLVDEILKQAVQYLMKLDESLPRTESEFIARVESSKPQLSAVVNQIALHIYAIHQQYHKVMKQLNGKVSLESVVILNDIKSQVAALIHAEYISNISWYQLQQYPRYMQAIEIRLEKFAREIPRQRLLSEQLQQQWNQYQQHVSQQKKLGLWKRDWHSYRWLLEEYRVSLFAQQLGTSEPVSEKRMKQHWQTLIADKNQ
jgi:ATP-dependent helicase HrpA